MVSNLVIFS